MKTISHATFKEKIITVILFAIDQSMFDLTGINCFGWTDDDLEPLLKAIDGHSEKLIQRINAESTEISIKTFDKLGFEVPQ